MAWKKPVANTIEDLEDAIAKAVEINKVAERCWLDSRDIRLEAIAGDSKEIQKLLSRVNKRLIALFGQKQMFEPNRSLGPEARRRMEDAKQD